MRILGWVGGVVDIKCIEFLKNKKGIKEWDLSKVGIFLGRVCIGSEYDKIKIFGCVFFCF